MRPDPLNVSMSLHGIAAVLSIDHGHLPAADGMPEFWVTTLHLRTRDGGRTSIDLYGDKPLGLGVAIAPTPADVIEGESEESTEIEIEVPAA